MWVMRSTGPGSKELLIEQVENLNTEVVERKAHNVVIASVDATNQRTTCCLLDPISARFVHWGAGIDVGVNDFIAEIPKGDLCRFVEASHKRLVLSFTWPTRRSGARDR